MDFDKFYQSAARMLDEREQVLYAHLLRLVDGDKDLFRQIKERLIAEGRAKDQFGVGLIRTGSVPVITTHEQSANEVVFSSASASLNNGRGATENVDSEWWLMASGVIDGPFPLVKLCDLYATGQIKLGDVVREGVGGSWLQPEQVAALKAVKPASVDRSVSDGMINGKRQVAPLYIPPIPKTAVIAGSTPTSEQNRYFVKSLDDQNLQVTHNELLQMLQSGQLTLKDPVRLRVLDSWDPISRFVDESEIPEKIQFERPIGMPTPTPPERRPIPKSIRDEFKRKTSVEIPVESEPFLSLKTLVSRTRSPLADHWKQAEKAIGGKRRLQSVCASIVILVGNDH